LKGKAMALKLLKVKASELLDCSESLTPAALGLDLRLNDLQVQVGLTVADPSSPFYQNLFGALKNHGIEEGPAMGQSYRLSKNKSFQAWLSALRVFFAAAYRIDAASISLDLFELQSRARNKNDLSTLTRAVEIKAKLAGVFDGGLVIVDDEETRRLTERELVEAQAIATLRLRQIDPSLACEPQGKVG
jgi:hypothetical protein